jgi:DNA replication and repair protein RecF
VYLLATTKSFRASRDSEAIQTGASEAEVSATVRRRDGANAEVAITVGVGERKQARINGARVPRAIELLGAMQAVFFGALDLRLVTGDPPSRRRYMDLAISQTSPAYCRDLAAYRKALTHRSHLLRSLRDRWVRDSGLEVWNEQLVRYGSPIVMRRQAFARELAELAAEAHGELSGSAETLLVRYVSSPRLPDAAGPEESVSAFTEALERLRDEEVRRGATLVGPQRDDLKLEINGMEARVYGSQGQQRTVVLSLKMAEQSYMEGHSGERPVMLLDDVMSDLDDERRARLLQRVRGHCQTFVTCTNLRGFPPELLSNARVFVVEAGDIRTCEP